MIKRAARSPGQRQRRWWPTPSIVLSAVALFVVLGGSAVAASGLIRAGDIAPGAVTGKAIRSGAVKPQDLSMGTRALLAGAPGANGAQGDAGSPGSAGSNGANGADGRHGANGANGPNGANGTNGIDGIDGTDGVDGIDGVKGTDGTDGTIAPLSAKQGLTALPTTSPPTIVVELAVPAGSYVVLAKTQLSHTGAGDSIECLLKAGTTTLDQVAMKTLPALAAIPASLQAVTTITTSPTQLSVQCDVAVANGSADFSSLIAIPTA
ncbi:MAG TPA: collagen-like protein [Solirubrobacterales bacterium]|nr:collagen-like protein [Solirubrobacterales bacterium]